MAIVNRVIGMEDKIQDPRLTFGRLIWSGNPTRRRPIPGESAGQWCTARVITSKLLNQFGLSDGRGPVMGRVNPDPPNLRRSPKFARPPRPRPATVSSQLDSIFGNMIGREEKYNRPTKPSEADQNLTPSVSPFTTICIHTSYL